MAARRVGSDASHDSPELDAANVPVTAPTSPPRAVSVPAGLMGLDIGPATVALFGEHLGTAKTVLWNGPMGVFELEPFAAGTRGVAEALAASTAFSVVGGGDSLAAIHRAGLDGSFDHLTTGGGASLEFLQGRALPGIVVLEDPERP